MENIKEKSRFNGKVQVTKNKNLLKILKTTKNLMINKKIKSKAMKNMLEKLATQLQIMKEFIMETQQLNLSLVFELKLIPNSF